MTRLLVDRPLSPGEELVVDGSELHYLRSVRREGPGDLVELRGREGQVLTARIAEIDRRHARLVVERAEDAPADQLQLRALVAVPRRKVMGALVRQLAEIGVAELVPVIGRRSVARPGDSRLERWRRIAAESQRQSGRARPLRVLPPTALDDALEAPEEGWHGILLHPGEGSPPLAEVLWRAARPAGIAVAVGPEGGFAPEEIELAERRGFALAGLGSDVQRVETAAVVAAALAAARLGAFGAID